MSHSFEPVSICPLPKKLATPITGNSEPPHVEPQTIRKWWQAIEVYGADMDALPPSERPGARR
jgi:hypothetical protein